MYQHPLKCHLTPITSSDKDINIMNERYQDQKLHIFQPKYYKDIPSNNLHQDHEIALNMKIYFPINATIAFEFNNL
jgi:hypothetical protein